ncbi:hypothetical protein GCM10027414_36040 [Humibacter ginsengiterrae]
MHPAHGAVEGILAGEHLGDGRDDLFEAEHLADARQHRLPRNGLTPRGALQVDRCRLRSPVAGEFAGARCFSTVLFCSQTICATANEAVTFWHRYRIHFSVNMGAPRLYAAYVNSSGSSHAAIDAAQSGT